MDLEDALVRLRGGERGVESWNRARESDPSIPDLDEADLSRIGLMGVNLRGVRLRRAHFGGSHLDGSDLRDADLRSADLQACRLHGANLCGADLRGANLRSVEADGADFTDADLRGTTLVGTQVLRITLHIGDLEDIQRSMCRAEKLPLPDDVRDSLLEFLQKLEFSDSLSHCKQQTAVPHFDELLTAMLRSPPDRAHVSKLLAMINEAAPPLAAAIAESDFVERLFKPAAI